MIPSSAIPGPATGCGCGKCGGRLRLRVGSPACMSQLLKRRRRRPVIGVVTSGDEVHRCTQRLRAADCSQSDKRTDASRDLIIVVLFIQSRYLRGRCRSTDVTLCAEATTVYTCTRTCVIVIIISGSSSITGMPQAGAQLFP